MQYHTPILNNTCAPQMTYNRLYPLYREMNYFEINNYPIINSGGAADAMADHSSRVSW